MYMNMMVYVSKGRTNQRGVTVRPLHAPHRQMTPSHDGPHTFLGAQRIVAGEPVKLQLSFGPAAGHVQQQSQTKVDRESRRKCGLIIEIVVEHTGFEFIYTQL